MRNARPLFFDLIRSVVGWVSVGVATVVLFFPVLAAFLVLYGFDRDRKDIHPFVSLWAKTILMVCPLMRIHFEGQDHLTASGPYVLVANHQSNADILALLHLRHPFKFIAKRELFWIPFFGWSISLAGYIPLIRGDQKSGREAIQKARGYLKRGVSVLFFPEGTRSHDGEIQDFKVGAFKLAAETDRPVVPIAIHGTRELLPKGRHLLGRRVEVLIKIGTPRPPIGKGSSSIEAFTKKVRSEMVDTLNEIRSRFKTFSAASFPLPLQGERIPVSR